MAVYEKDGPRSDAENSDLCNLALSGLRLLSNWTADVVDTYAWKLHNPAHPRQNPDCPADAEEYAKVWIVGGRLAGLIPWWFDWLSFGCVVTVTRISSAMTAV